MSRTFFPFCDSEADRNEEAAIYINKRIKFRETLSRDYRKSFRLIPMNSYVHTFAFVFKFMLSVKNLQAKSFPSLLVLVKKRLPIEINSKTLSPNTLDRQCILE